VFGTPDVTTALVIVALFLALLLGLLSYHSRQRSRYINRGVALLVFVTVLALLSRAIERPDVGTALVVLLLATAVMLAIMTFHSGRWAWGIWFIGILLFFLGLPFLGTGRGDLALLCLIGGPGLLMLVAALQPEIPVRLARLGALDAPPAITAQEVAYERQRYARLAAGITVLCLAGVWLFGGVPQGPVTEAAVPMVFDEAKAARGAQLFNEFGCNACHSVTGAAGAGPTLKGVYGHRVRLDDGRLILADEAYIRESILEPDAKTVMGFSRGVMAGAISARMSDIRQPNNLDALVEYIKSLAR
jgi:cytochrome c